MHGDAAKILFTNLINDFILSKSDLKIQLNDTTGAAINITYGLANATDDMLRAYYESQTPYQVPVKAGFTYLKGILKFTLNLSELKPLLALRLKC